MRRSRFDANPFPSEPDFHFGLVDEKYDGDRKDLDAPATDADGKSSLQLNLTDLPDLTRPLRRRSRSACSSRAAGRSATNLTRPIRERPMTIGLRSPAGDDAVPEGDAGQGRRHRARRRRQAHRAPGPALGAAARDLALRLVLDERHVAPPHADPRRADRQRRGRHRRWRRGDPVAQPARGPLSLGGRRYRERRAIEPAVSCRLVCRGRAARRARQDVGDARQDRATSPARPPSCSSRRRSPARPSWRSPSDSVISMRSFTLPEGGTTLEIPVDANWGSGVYALVTAYRPPAPPAAGSATAPRRAVPAARSGWRGSASTRRRAARR